MIHSTRLAGIEQTTLRHPQTSSRSSLGCLQEVRGVLAPMDLLRLVHSPTLMVYSPMSLKRSVSNISSRGDLF